MKRRTLLASLALTPVRANAAVPAIGYLTLNGRTDTVRWRSFIEGLGDRGFVDGKTVTTVLASAEGQPERLRPLAAILVERRVDMIFASSGTADAPHAARAASTTLPVVFLVTGDPVRDGLVDSLAVPNGNLTGVALMQDQTTSKQAEMLAALLPDAAPIAILMDDGAAGLTVTGSGGALQAKLGRRIVFVRASDESGLNRLLASLAVQKVAGLVVAGGAAHARLHQQLAAMAARHRLPAVYADVEADLARSGGLMSYGASVPEMYRWAGTMAGRILAGAPPRTMPVQHPTRLTLRINLRAARQLGLTVPSTVLARADDVIE